jgi:solute carrier family 25 iron transporter 28/37
MTHSPYAGVWDCARGTVREQGFGALYRSYPTTLAMNVPFTAIHFTAYESAKIALGKHAWFAKNDSESGSSGEMDEETFAAQFAAGGLAGGLAAAATNPLDVVKTRMQTHCEVAACEVGLSVKPELQPGTGKGVCAITGDPVACKATNGSGVSELAQKGASKIASKNPYGSSSLPAAMRAVVAEEGAAALLRGIGPRVLFHIPAGAISWATYEAGKRVLGIDGGGGQHY